MRIPRRVFGLFRSPFLRLCADYVSNVNLLFESALQYLHRFVGRANKRNQVPCRNREERVLFKIKLLKLIERNNRIRFGERLKRLHGITKFFYGQRLLRKLFASSIK